MKPSLLTTAALAALLLAGAGCAGPALRSSPRLAFASDVRPATSCRVTGEARAIATHALADEIQVRATPGGGFAVAILDAVDPCLTVHVGRDGSPLGEPDALPVGAELERTEPKLAVAVRETFLLVRVLLVELAAAGGCRAGNAV